MLRFAYRLGWHFKKLHPVREILFGTDRRNLAYWMAYLQLEPTDAARADIREAVHAAFLGDRIALATEPTDPNELIMDWQKLSEPPPEKPISRAEARRAEADALIVAINAVFRH